MAQLERITQTTEFLGLLSEFKPREKALGLEILESGGVMQLKREGEFEEWVRRPRAGELVEAAP